MDLALVVVEVFRNREWEQIHIRACTGAWAQPQVHGDLAGTQLPGLRHLRWGGCLPLGGKQLELAG